MQKEKEKKVSSAICKQNNNQENMLHSKLSLKPQQNFSDLKISKTKSYLEKVKPFIYEKKGKLDFKTIPLNLETDLSGYVKYYPAASQEWSNSVYSYNSNYNKLLNIANENIIHLIKSYLNLRSKKNKKKKRYLELLNLMYL